MGGKSTNGEGLRRGSSKSHWLIRAGRKDEDRDLWTEPFFWGGPEISAGRPHLQVSSLLSFVSFQLRSDSGWTTHESFRLYPLYLSTRSTTCWTVHLHSLRAPQQGKPRSDLKPSVALWPTNTPWRTCLSITDQTSHIFLIQYYRKLNKIFMQDGAYRWKISNREGKKIKTLFPTETQK